MKRTLQECPLQFSFPVEAGQTVQAPKESYLSYFWSSSAYWPGQTQSHCLCNFQQWNHFKNNGSYTGGSLAPESVWSPADLPVVLIPLSSFGSDKPGKRFFIQKLFLFLCNLYTAVCRTEWTLLQIRTFNFSHVWSLSPEQFIDDSSSWLSAIICFLLISPGIQNPFLPTGGHFRVVST